MIRSEQEVGKLFFLASPTHAITNTTACFQVREGAHTKYNIHDSEPIEILRLKISIPPKPRDTLRRAGCDVDTGRGTTGSKAPWDKKGRTWHWHCGRLKVRKFKVSYIVRYCVYI